MLAAVDSFACSQDVPDLAAAEHHTHERLIRPFERVSDLLR
jgi:hypothetical protein